MDVKYSAQVNKRRLNSQDLSETLCGYGPCKPTWLQKFANPKLFTFVVAFIFIAKGACFAYFGGILATLERRFKLSSTESSTLTIINEIAELSIVIIVSYFGHTGHRPRWIGLGVILWGIGTLICALPHFLSDPLDPNAVISGTFSQRIRMQKVGVCQNDTYASINDGRNSSTSSQCTKETTGIGPVKWIIAGQILAGLASAPGYPLIFSYLDDCVGKLRLTSFIAPLLISSVLGLSGGYILSSYTTSLYVDFDRIPSQDIPDIHRYDPRWIGAWWLGFIITAVVAMVFALPLFFFPKKMKTDYLDSELEEEEETGDHEKSFVVKPAQFEGNESCINGTAKCVHGILKALKRLFHNIPLRYMYLAAGCETAIFASLGTFGIKTSQVQFTISPGLASGILGGLLLAANIVSQILSAYICRRWKLGIRGCARMILICEILGFVTFPILMFVGCQNFNIAGINVDYSALSTQTVDDTLPRNIMHPCNHNCGCEEDVFRPVCGSDGITYISPCHAGCELTISGNTSRERSYADCKCIVDQTTADTNSFGTAASGLCLDCGMLVFAIAVVINICGVIAIFSAANPLISMTMRIVDEEDRSIVMAVKNVFTKCVGYFPAPVLLGTIINRTCIYWQRSCGNRGSCWLYDIVSYRYVYYGMISILRCGTIFCWFMINKYVSSEQSQIENFEHVDDNKDLQTPVTDCGSDRSMQSTAKGVRTTATTDGL